MAKTAWKPQGTFDHYWFCNLTMALWERYILPRKRSINHYLEIGVCEGQSMLWVLEHLVNKPHGRAVGVDVFTPSRNWHHGEGDEHMDRTVGNISLLYGSNPVDCPREAKSVGASRALAWNGFNDDPSRPACEIYKADSRDFMRLESREFDCIFVDGGHDANVALPDIVNAFRLLRVGGLLIIDDNERRWRGGRPQVRIASQSFEMCFDGSYDLVYSHPKQVCYEKCKRRRRGKWPPTIEAGPSIAPVGATGSED